jgi:DDE superfamily endonuclease
MPFHYYQSYWDWPTSYHTFFSKLLGHTVALILHNGSMHAPKQLTRWVHELPTMLEGKLAMQLYWLPKNASWLDQIEIWFSLLQRKLLQPNHFTSLDELQQAIQDFIIHYNQTANPLSGPTLLRN